MGKVTANAIRAKIIQVIRRDWKTLKWVKLDIDRMQKIESLEVALANDFQYEGHGEYQFSAHISFMAKVTNGGNREFYKISPYAKMFIEETEDDFNIDLSFEIPLTKLQ